MNESHALVGQTERDTSFAARTPPGGQEIARMRCSTQLPVPRKQDLRLIHDEMSDPVPADLFRDLRARLLLDSPRSNPVIVVSGVRRGCGTSFVARNLAAAIAMDPERSVLLLDCNLRHASVQRSFDLDDGPGLSDWLRTPTLRIELLLRQSGVPRLRLITAGRVCSQAREQLASLRMRALLEELRERYVDRCLVIDAPAALGAPEARMLGQRADQILLVAGEGMHRPDVVLEAARCFDPARFAGVVFNQVP